MSHLNLLSQRAVVVPASEMMRRELLTLSPSDDLFDSVGRLLRHNISGAPVIDAAQNYLGVFSEKSSITALTKVIDVARDLGLHQIRVRDFMTSKLVTLDGSLDVFDAIDHLLSKRISGAPVVDDKGAFRGIFSEKTAMRVLSAALHDGLPGSKVEDYMNVDRNRIIDQSDLLIDIAQRFLETPYRRLPVLRDGILIGQVSRRDVLKAEHQLAAEVQNRGQHGDVSDAVRLAIVRHSVADFMDDHAMTATPTTDLLAITQIFLNSPHRRLPIVDGRRLVGQISRRDLMAAAAKMMGHRKQSGSAETLYLSGTDLLAPASLK